MSKVMFITGAGSGIGQLAAKRALASGCKVAAVDINLSGINKLKEGLKSEDNLLCIELDITNVEQVNKAVAQCEQSLGPIDRLINCAGIMPLGSLAEQPAEIAKRITEINYFGLINLVSAIYPGMIERKSGEIVSFASLAGHWPTYSMGAYCASKSAVATYSQVLHYEAKRHDIRVVCVCPPVVSTPLLQQADETVRPKLFDLLPPLKPEVVVDKIDRVLKGNGFWVFPGPFTRFSWGMTRWTPNLVWWLSKKIEGL